MTEFQIEVFDCSEETPDANAYADNGANNYADNGANNYADNDVISYAAGGITIRVAEVSIL